MIKQYLCINVLSHILFFSYLYRGDKEKEKDDKEKEKSSKKDKDRSRDRDRGESGSRRDKRGQKWQPFRGYTKSGKKIKGRGILVRKLINLTLGILYIAIM